VRPRGVRRGRALTGVLSAIAAQVLGNVGGIVIGALTKDQLDPLTVALAVGGVSVVIGLLVTLLPEGERHSVGAAPQQYRSPSRRPTYVPTVATVLVILLLFGIGGVAAAWAVQKGYGALCGQAGLCRSADAVQITAYATGRAPWVVEGYGHRFEVASTVRTTSEWQFKKRPSITVTAYVTRSQKTFQPAMDYRISDQGSGTALEAVPFQGSGDGNPPIGQRSKLVFVVWDASPRATKLVFTLHDFYWPDGRDVILRDVPVPGR
jgi:hypothetical protein